MREIIKQSKTWFCGTRRPVGVELDGGDKEEIRSHVIFVNHGSYRGCEVNSHDIQIYRSVQSKVLFLLLLLKNVYVKDALIPFIDCCRLCLKNVHYVLQTHKH